MILHLRDPQVTYLSFLIIVCFVHILLYSFQALRCEIKNRKDTYSRMQISFKNANRRCNRSRQKQNRKYAKWFGAIALYGALLLNFCLRMQECKVFLNYFSSCDNSSKTDLLLSDSRSKFFSNSNSDLLNRADFFSNQKKSDINIEKISEKCYN